MAGDDIHDLVHRASAGDAAAIERLLELVRPHLEQVADRFIDRHHPSRSAQDLVQDAWIQAWQKLDQFHGTDQNGEQMLAMFRVWVGRILIRLGLNSARDRRARRRHPGGRLVRLDSRDPAQSSGNGLEPPADILPPSAIARANEQARLIQEAMARCLGAEEREIVRLKFFDGLTLGQIAERLNLTYDQVRERHRAGMRRLERELGPLR